MKRLIGECKYQGETKSEILVTYMETDVAELRNFGNKKRDDKNVINIHP